MIDKRIKKIIIVFAAVIVLVAAGMYLVKFFKSQEPKEKTYVPSSSQILFGLNFVIEAENDMVVLENNIMSDPRFKDYGVKKEYCMIYHADSEEKETELVEYLGIKDEIPDIDYEVKDLFFSVGRSITNISDKDKNMTDSGQKLISVEYSEEYYRNKVFVYSMRKIDFVSGAELELYYLEKVHPAGNLIEGDRGDSEILSEGKYHKIYKKAENVYEYALYRREDNRIISRAVLDTQPEINEVSDTFVEVISDGVRFFYNPTSEKISQKTDYKTYHVVNNIVAYARVYNSDIVLMVRDVFNISIYGYYFKVPFSKSVSEVNSLLTKVEYIDDTHLRIEYYKGSDKKLVTEELNVPNMNLIK